MTRIFVGTIRLYQILVSIDALEKYGPWKGLWLTILRVGKCHPWHEGGYDPVN